MITTENNAQPLGAGVLIAIKDPLIPTELEETVRGAFAEAISVMATWVDPSQIDVELSLSDEALLALTKT